MPFLVTPSPPTTLSSGDPLKAIAGLNTGPGGVESVISYGGTLLNVREWVDTILITSIDGLGDADVRDTREVNPGQHGETPFASYYGGRTIVLSGKIRAHTVEKLRDIQTGLRATFSDLSKEQPLTFLSGDINTDILINCKKSQSLVMAEAQQHQNRFEREFQVTLRASNPRFLSYLEVASQAIYGFAEPFNDMARWDNEVGFSTSISIAGGHFAATSTSEKRYYAVGYFYTHSDWRKTVKFHSGASPAPAGGPSIAIGGRVNSSNFIYGEVLPAGATSTVRVSRIDAGGAVASFASGSFALAANTDYWLRVTKSGNQVTASVYNADPAVGAPAAIGTATYTLTSTDITKFGTGVATVPAFRMIGVPPDWYIDDFIMEPVVDRVAYAVTNKGNFPAQPVIRLYGPVNAAANGGPAARIANGTTGDDLTILAKAGSTVAVASGRYIEIDIAKRTMKEFNTAGVFQSNVFAQLDVSSDWFELQPDVNQIELHTFAGGQPSLELRHRHTWI